MNWEDCEREAYIDWEAYVLQSWVDFYHLNLCQPNIPEGWHILNYFYENLHPSGRQYIDYTFNGKTFSMDPDEVLDYIHYLARCANYTPNYDSQLQPPSSQTNHQVVAPQQQQPSLEDSLNSFIQVTSHAIDEMKIFTCMHTQAISKLANQVGQIATKMGESEKENFPSQGVHDSTDNYYDIDNFEHTNEFEEHISMGRCTNTLGDEILCFKYNNELEVDDMDLNLNDDNVVYNDHFETSSVKSTNLSGINSTPNHITPIIKHSELHEDNVYFTQAEVDLLNVQNEERQQNNIEGLILSEETYVPIQEEIKKLDQCIDDFTLLSNLEISSQNDHDVGEVELEKNNTLIDESVNALNNDTHMCYKHDDKLMGSFKDDVYDDVNKVCMINSPVKDSILLSHRIDPLEFCLAHFNFDDFNVEKSIEQVNALLDSTPNYLSNKWEPEFMPLSFSLSPPPKSILEPPKFESKVLLDFPKHAYLGSFETLSINISFYPNESQEEKLLSVLKDNKDDIWWSIPDTHYFPLREYYNSHDVEVARIISSDLEPDLNLLVLFSFIFNMLIIRYIFYSKKVIKKIRYNIFHWEDPQLFRLLIYDN